MSFREFSSYNCGVLLVDFCGVYRGDEFGQTYERRAHLKARIPGRRSGAPKNTSLLLLASESR
eukprot:6111182-Amphidinium_carterae.1